MNSRNWGGVSDSVYLKNVDNIPNHYYGWLQDQRQGRKRLASCKTMLDVASTLLKINKNLDGHYCSTMISFRLR